MNETAETKPHGAPFFDWADPFLLHEQLSDEERLIQETAHAFAENRLRPRVVEAYAHEKTDRSIFDEMGELGLLGLTLPLQYGGAGFPMSPMASSPARSSASIPAIAA